MTTKRTLIQLAFEELGLATYVYDIEPEQLQSALLRMDLIVGNWEAEGLTLGYPVSSDITTSSLDTDVVVSASAQEAIYLHLAIALASSFGKNPNGMTLLLKRARKAYKGLLNLKPTTPEQQLPGTTPAGAGNRSHDRRPFLSEPADEPLGNTPGNNLSFLE